MAADDLSWKALISEIKEVILPALEDRLKQYSDANRDKCLASINQISDKVDVIYDIITNMPVIYS